MDHEESQKGQRESHPFSSSFFQSSAGRILESSSMHEGIWPRAAWWRSAAACGDTRFGARPVDVPSARPLRIRYGTKSHARSSAGFV
jgi:hypothetical protein